MRRYLLVPFSRLLNVLTGGTWPELFCARMEREHPKLAARIDAAWLRLTGEKGHCRSCLEE